MKLPRLFYQPLAIGAPAPLRELPVELVLVSHGAPVLRDGARAIERALDGAT